MLGVLLQLGWCPSKEAQQRSGCDSSPGRRRPIYGQALSQSRALRIMKALAPGLAGPGVA